MKKKYTLLFSTAILFSITNAQTNSDVPFKKGDKLLGGSIGFSNINPSGTDKEYYSASIGPSLGYFTKSNRLLGASLSFGFQSPSNGSSRSYGVSLLKQYWNSLGKNFYFIIQGNIKANYLRNTSYNNDSIGSSFKNLNRFYDFSFSIQTGIAYRINKRLVADAFLANLVSVADHYFVYKLTQDNRQIIHNTSNSISINSSLSGFNLSSIQFGFRYIL